MVPLSSVKITRVPTYLICQSKDFVYGTITHYGRTSQSVPLSLELIGWSPFARRYLGNLGWFLFLRVLRCFSSPGSLPKTYVFSQRIPGLYQVGFPIQTSLDHRLVATFPELFAGSNVFHRLPLPRHPPYALSRLTINLNSFYTS